MKISELRFDEVTPVAPQGLGGLVRDHFANGRIYATVGAHGGLLSIGYWGNQHLGASRFFRGDAETAWGKLFRIGVRIGGKRYYLALNETRLYPFGCGSRCMVEDVEISHELLLLPDALVQRMHVTSNPRNVPIQFEMVHQESVTAVSIYKRSWEEFAFQPTEKTLVVSCRDESEVFCGARDGGLVQKDAYREVHDAPDVTTWIGIGCDAPLSIRRGYRRRSKYYISSDPIQGDTAAFFVAFATRSELLNTRLEELSKTVHVECNQLVSNYEARLLACPQIDVGDSVLNSAFGQFPEVIESMKIPDRPGATRATAAGYFVWGWDGMTPMVSSVLANDSSYTADVFRFFHETIDPEYGLAHQFISSFQLRLSQSFPSQCQYIASLYHYVATTGDLSLAREVWSTCIFVLDGCRRNVVGETGLAKGSSLWPDEPRAMDENGNDISSLNNSFLYQGLRSMEFLAHALGHEDVAEDCREWAHRLRASFIEYLYDEEHGYFVTSCSSETMEPRKHYGCQVIFWITPFARELVSHAPERISAFMDKHLRSDKCLLSLPQWDTAWMADGNQIGASFPIADYFYLNIHKLVGDDDGLKAWLGDVEWFWQRHTAPEAFTPEAENEADFGPDNPGCKQLQAVTCWYASLYIGLAGMDFDHDGLTLTPWGDQNISIRGLKLHDVSIDLSIRGSGTYIGALSVNGKPLPAGSHKIAWSVFKDKTAKIELLRSEAKPNHPVILRADGLHVGVIETGDGILCARVEGSIGGEIIVQAPESATFSINALTLTPPYHSATGTFTIPFLPGRSLEIKVSA